MQRSERIARLVEISRLEERKKARELGQARDLLQQQKHTLDNLLDHKKEYLANIKARGGQGVSATYFQGYRDFLNQLDQAISLQQTRVRQEEIKVEKAIDAWQLSQQRMKSMDNARERISDEEKSIAARAEQNRMDDLVQSRIGRGSDEQ